MKALLIVVGGLTVFVGLGYAALRWLAGRDPLALEPPPDDDDGPSI